MKRIVLWALSTVSVVVLLFGYSTSTSGPLATSASTSFVSGSTAGGTTASPAPAAGSTPSTTPATPAAPSTDGSDGSDGSDSSDGPATTLTGDVAQTRWGPVQVELTMAGDTITDVSVLQYPSGNHRDVEINDVALPILVQDTLDAQSADIDVVSGATVTSDGYLQSLQSALDQA